MNDLDLFFFGAAVNFNRTIMEYVKFGVATHVRCGGIFKRQLSSVAVYLTRLFYFDSVRSIQTRTVTAHADCNTKLELWKQADLNLDAYVLIVLPSKQLTNVFLSL